MKDILKPINFFFLKLPVISMSIIAFTFNLFLFKDLFTDHSSDLQMCFGMLCILLNVILWLFVPSLLKDESKTLKLINYITLFIILVFGIFLLNDFKQRPNHYDIDNSVTITQTKANTIIVETQFVLFSYNSTDVKFDSLHPLKAYSCYKIDIFGNKTPGYTCIKSDLMNEYKFTNFSRK